MSAARSAPRGWCPSVEQPMESGDGLLVRVHPRRGRLDADALAGCARAARRHGNGTIDLTRRGSLQLRGAQPSTLAGLSADLAALGFTGGDAGAENWRHLMVSPLAGLDPSCHDFGPAADALSRSEEIGRLPPKCLILLDGGGRLDLSEHDADIRLEATGADPALPIRVSLGGTAEGAADLGCFRSETIGALTLRVVARAMALAPAQAWRVRDILARRGTAPFLDAIADQRVAPAPVPHHESPSPIGYGAMDARGGWFGLALPFGSGDAAAFEALAELARRFGDGTLRLTPWRAVILASVRLDDAETLRARAEEFGFITASDDPRLSLIACPGAPACASALGATRAPALRLIETLRPRLTGAVKVHLSGCAKGCAASNPADIVMVAARSGYHLGFATTPAEAVARPALDPARIDAELGAWAGAGSLSSKDRTVMAKPRPDYIRDGAEIYCRSFAIIRREAELSRFSPDEAGVAVRIIHACGMVEIAGALVFSADLVAAARGALRGGAPILCNSKMVANGITRARLPAENAIVCTLADDRVPALAKELGTTRTAAAMELWRDRLAGAVVAIGNAPTALFRLLELMDEGMAPPAAIIGMPVGFVGAAESKEALAADGRVPSLIVRGRQGGSAMTVAAINALASEVE